MPQSISPKWQILRPSSTKKGCNAYVWAQCPLCKSEFDVRKNHAISGRSRMCRSCSRKITPSNQTGRRRRRTLQIIELFKEGRLTAAEIAKEVNCGREHVYAVQRKHVGMNLREAKKARGGRTKVEVLELEQVSEPHQEKGKDPLANLNWSEIIPEWDCLDDFQRKMAEENIWIKITLAQKKMIFSMATEWKGKGVENYINYCLDPGFLSLETEKSRVLKLMEGGKPFFPKEVSINAGVSLRRAKLILNNFYKDGTLTRHHPETKDDFCYLLSDKKKADSNIDCERIKNYIKDISPYRADIFSHFDDLPQNFIERAIAQMKKTHGLGSLWCLERKQIYYEFGKGNMTARALYKELLLQQFADYGPSTVFAVNKRLGKREATLRVAAQELFAEGKIVVVRSSSRAKVYGLAEGVKECIEQMSN